MDGTFFSLSCSTTYSRTWFTCIFPSRNLVLLILNTSQIWKSIWHIDLIYKLKQWFYCDNVGYLRERLEIRTILSALISSKNQQYFNPTVNPFYVSLKYDGTTKCVICLTRHWHYMEADISHLSLLNFKDFGERPSNAFQIEVIKVRKICPKHALFWSVPTEST